MREEFCVIADENFCNDKYLPHPHQNGTDDTTRGMSVTEGVTRAETSMFFARFLNNIYHVSVCENVILVVQSHLRDYLVYNISVR